MKELKELKDLVSIDRLEMDKKDRGELKAKSKTKKERKVNTELSVLKKESKPKPKPKPKPKSESKPNPKPKHKKVSVVSVPKKVSLSKKEKENEKEKEKGKEKTVKKAIKKAIKKVVKKASVPAIEFVPGVKRSKVTKEAIKSGKEKLRTGVLKTLFDLYIEKTVLKFGRRLSIELPNFVDMNLAKTILGDLEGLLSVMERNTKKGYVNTTEDVMLDAIIEKYFREEKPCPKVCNLERYTLVYQALLLNIYLMSRYITIELSKEIVEKEKETKKKQKETLASSSSAVLIRDVKDEYQEELTDLLADYEVFSQKIHKRFSTIILSKIQKRGISMHYNTYSAFDTEFYLKDESVNMNELLSIQIALNTRLVINIPIQTAFSFRDSINSLTGQLHKFQGDWHNMLNYEEGIQIGIDRIRKLLYKDYDLILTNIIKNIEASDQCKKVIVEEKGLVQYVTKFTPVKTQFKFTDSYSFSKLLEDSMFLSLKEIQKTLSKAFEEMGLNYEMSNEIMRRLLTQRGVRTTTVIGEGGMKLSITVIKNLYLCCHYSVADLCMLSDFESIKELVDILQKTYASLGKIDYEKNKSVNIYLRDTSLLAPAGKKSLESLGEMHGGDFTKVKIPIKHKSDMLGFKNEDPKMFEEYAMQDAVVTLKHINEMEDIHVDFGKVGVPLTLSSLSRTYLLNHWRQEGYSYQVNHEYLIGDTSAIQTPVGLSVMKEIGLYLPHYIGNLKGGRNESFMYGVDKETKWYDYDITSAYTTAMCMLCNPKYEDTRLITDRLEIEKCISDDNRLLFGYVIIKAEFEFPEGTKYPSIPCYLEKGKNTVYPLKGECMLTGPEYLVAVAQGCVLKPEYVVEMPCEQWIEKEGEGGKVTYPNKPFYKVIKELQAERVKYPKGSFLNNLYKEMANSLYGNVVKGVSNKKFFNVKSNSTVSVTANLMSNPVIGCYITSFIRSLLGECLHNISEMGGRIVSSTTDGFITNVENLEEKLLKLPEKSIQMLNLFRSMRKDLSGNSNTLELKNKGKGIISWTTRGQLGDESEIKATTGFQSIGLNKGMLHGEFMKIIGSNEKSVEFIQTRLRSGKDIFTKGGHVTMQYSDRVFKLTYDNRRLIKDGDEQVVKYEKVEMEEIIGEIEKEGKEECSLADLEVKEIDLTNELLDSSPMLDVKMCTNIRSMSRMFKTVEYSRKLPTKGKPNKYTRVIETAVRTFIKGLLYKEPLFGLERSLLPTYSEIIKFVHGFEGTRKQSLTKSSISHLKNRKTMIKTVPKNEVTIEFAEYIQQRFPNFRIDEFFK